MDIPLSLLGASATEGVVYYFSPECPVGIPDHRHICIKHNGRYILFSTCSSQIGTAQRLAKLRNWNQNTYPVISPSATNGFSKDTYIDCNNYIELSEAEFADLMHQRKIIIDSHGGRLTDKEMQSIVNGIRLSVVIPDEIKALF